MIVIINLRLGLICHQQLIMVLCCILVSPNNLLYLTLFSNYIVMCLFIVLSTDLYIKEEQKRLNKQCYNIRKH